MRKMQIISILLVIFAFLVSLWAYSLLPATVASHWGLNGAVNGHTNRTFGAFFVPILSLGLLILFSVLPALDPLKKNYEKFRAEYDCFMVVLLGFLVYIHLLTLCINLGFRLNLIQLLAPAFAMLMLYLGMLIEKAKQNWFVGIRTPWTLSSEIVWAKTHKLAGSMFKAAGIVALIGIVFPAIGLIACIGIIIATAVVSIIYSYLEFKKLKKKK